MQNRVSTSYARILYDYLESRGLDAVVSLDHPAPPIDHTGHSFMDLRELAVLFAKADRLLAEPALGLKVGATIKPHHIGLVGYLLTHCRNLAHAMYRHNEFERLYWDGNLGRIRPELFGARILWDPIPHLMNRLLEECNLAAFVSFARTIAGAPHENPVDVHFSFPEPKDRSVYDDFFRCPVHFNARHLSVSISWANLLRPLVAPDESLHHILELQARERIAKIPARGDFLGQLRAVIAARLTHETPDLARCAEQLNCSARTLQRRLEGLGTSFQDELDRTRRDLAESYLADPGLKLSELSLLLGYAEQSVFTRAFKRWTGVTPARWRKQLGR